MTFTAPSSAFFRPQIDALPGSVKRNDILNDLFLLGREGQLSVYYAPLDWINVGAPIIVVGLTPGWSQTKIVFDEYGAALRRGLSEPAASKAAKAQASFAGMRTRLCRWLDDLGVGEWLGLDTTDTLFLERRALVHTTSLIRYPVFVGPDAKNYTGYYPTPVNSSFLFSIIEAIFVPELAQLPESLIVPLGRSVTTALAALGVDPRRCLFGFPHPSGANGHGPAQYAKERDAMRRVVSEMPSDS